MRVLVAPIAIKPGEPCSISEAVNQAIRDVQRDPGAGRVVAVQLVSAGAGEIAEHPGWWQWHLVLSVVDSEAEKGENGVNWKERVTLREASE